MNDIIRNGAILLVYLFIVILLWIVLSGPFDTLMTSFDDLNLSGSDTHIESGTSINRTVFNIIMGGAFLGPMIWFVVWVFRREPDWRV